MSNRTKFFSSFRNRKFDAKRFEISALTKAATAFCVILLNLIAVSVSAQSRDFLQIGQIRAIVSETETKLSPKGNTQNVASVVSSGVHSKTDFYFVYVASINGAETEKWVALSENEDWSRFSNQRVRLSGSLFNNKLSNAVISPLTDSSEENLLVPPTAGLYKVVVVPLTIQSVSALGGKRTADKAASNITPEAIRHSLFNAPNSVNKFYLEASYGKFGLTGVYHPQADVVPVTIQATISRNCQEQIINEFTPIVIQRLREQNINATSGGAVDLGIIIFNDTPGCPPYPFVPRGVLGQRGAPSWIWMPESWFVTGAAILTHEIGHALGGNHPISARCANFDDPQTCVYTDAADRSFMTSGGRFEMMPSNYERRRWGWHPPDAFVKPAGESVYPFNLHSPIFPLVKDSVRQGRFYFRNLSGAWSGWDVYPEARRNWGQFEQYQAADESFRLGIAIRLGHSNYTDPNALTILIDPNGTEGVEDAPLRANQHISFGGITVKCEREHNPIRGTRMSVR